MKKVLVCMLAVGLAATVADAATLRLNFAPDDGGGNTATIVQGGSAIIEVWADVIATEAISGIGFQMNAIAGDPVSQLTHSAAIGVDGSNGDGVLGLLTDWGANYSPMGNLTSAGANFLGTMTMTSSVLTSGTPFELTIAHLSVSMLDSTGGGMTFAPGFAGFANFWQYGDYGGDDVNAGPLGISARNPLFLNVVPIPEPASLALLAFGGFAALRRRR